MAGLHNLREVAAHHSDQTVFSAAKFYSRATVGSARLRSVILQLLL